MFVDIYRATSALLCTENALVHHSFLTQGNSANSFEIISVIL